MAPRLPSNGEPISNQNLDQPLSRDHWELEPISASSTFRISTLERDASSWLRTSRTSSIASFIFARASSCGSRMTVYFTVIIADENYIYRRPPPLGERSPVRRSHRGSGRSDLDMDLHPKTLKSILKQADIEDILNG